MSFKVLREIANNMNSLMSILKAKIILLFKVGINFLHSDLLYLFLSYFNSNLPYKYNNSQ